MFKCDSHVRGHRTVSTAEACELRRKRRKARAQRRAEDIERRKAIRIAEPESAFIRRSFCIGQSPGERVAKYLRENYPPRPDEKTWDWALVVEEHSLNHVTWPTTEQLMAWLDRHPRVMLPSEVRKYARVSVESGRE